MTQSDGGEQGDQQDRRDYSDLSLVEVLKIENKIESENEVCPRCGEEYLDVGIFGDGGVQFTHEKDGMFRSGCDFDNPSEVEEVR